MINGRALAHLRPDDLGTVTEMMLNLVAEVASLSERVAALEAGGSGDAAELGSDVDAMLGRILPRR